MIFMTTDKSNTLLKVMLSKHETNGADQLDILSGYIGIEPVKKITNIKDIKTTIIYGMYNEINSIHRNKSKLHQLLVKHDETNDNLSVFYPRRMSHAKCYIWRKRGDIVSVMLGSANFSQQGLLTPWREVLSETSSSDWESVDNYYNNILSTCIPCYQAEQNEDIHEFVVDQNKYETRSLYSPKSKINWGQGNANTNKRDGYIPLQSPNIISKYPNLFPPKTRDTGLSPATGADNDPIEVIWDDGFSMTCLLEGTGWLGDIRYPNKISSYTEKRSDGGKKIMGDYLRYRLGVKPGDRVPKEVFDNYGRETITITLSSEGVYYMDFSSPKMK